MRGASTKYWSENHHIQHYTNKPTGLKIRHVCLLGMCVVLVPKIGISTSISNITQIRPQHFRNFMRVHWECICMVLVPNIGIITSIFNTTQIHPQHFRNFMCIHWECAWCQCQILVLEPPYPILQKYTHSNLETSCVCTGIVHGASAKYWTQNHFFQHQINMPTALHKLHVCPLGMCMVLVPNICISTSISNSTQKRPQPFRNFMRVHWECAWCQCKILVLEPPYPTLHKYTHSTSETSCVSTWNVRGASAKYWSQNNISNTTQICPQHYRNFMSVHWECAWCQCEIFVLAPVYPIVHKNAHSPSETSCVCTGNVHGASAKFWSQNHHIQHYTNTPTALQKLHVCPLGMCVVLVPNIGLRTTYPILHKYAHSTTETSCVSTENVRGASAKYWSQNHHIQHYTNTPTAIQKLHACSLGMCVVLVPNIDLITSIFNTTQIRPQHLRNFMCIQ